MGRGRAKAKQTKVARELKYQSFDPDFTSLERELRGKPAEDNSDYEDVPDPYADLAARYDSVDDDYDEGYDARKTS